MRFKFGIQSVLGAAVAGFVLGGFSQPAGALEISKHAKDSAEINAIQLKGRIDEGDTYELQVYIAGLPKKPKIVVYLNSPGGNLHEGMKLGRFFFTNKIETMVESKTGCASACGLAFLGGRDESGKPHRTKASSGGVGFHSFTREFDKDRSYTADDLKLVVQGTQSQVFIVAEYLKSIGTDLDVLRIMLRARANEMNFLSNDDALALNIQVWDEKRNVVIDPELVMDRIGSRAAANVPASPNGSSSTATAPRPVSANPSTKSPS